MIIKTDGIINKYYIQTLCMLFFPGAKFSENEPEEESTPVLAVSLRNSEAGCEAFASLKVGQRVKTGSRFEKFKPEYSKDRTAKIAIGIAVFQAGKRFFGAVPPWGILTGVRPAKIAAEMLLKGKDTEEIKKTLQKEYFVSAKKASLVTDIALTEKNITDSLIQDSCSVYISIPFCPSRCAYCSFVSYATPRLLSMIPDYLVKLCLDIRKMFETIKNAGKKVVTVYIGGGTPTVLDEIQLETLLSTVSECIDTSGLLEFTLEAGRPDTITKEKLEIAKKYGVTRISINPQTLNDSVLKNIGRNHTTEDFYRAFEIARESGIKNINTDLIAGLPGETFPKFAKSVDAILKLHPENVTVHTFCVKKSADILREDSDIYSKGGGDTPKSVEYAQVKAKNAGYIPYYLYRQKNTVGNLENVGFALPGSEGLYNIFIMEEVHPIFAVGAGAVSKLMKYTENGRVMERYAFPKYPYEYLNEKRFDSNEMFEKIASFWSEEK